MTTNDVTIQAVFEFMLALFEYLFDNNLSPNKEKIANPTFTYFVFRNGTQCFFSYSIRKIKRTIN